MQDDPGETRNLYLEYPQVIEELYSDLTNYVRNGRSTPGAPQSNDGRQWWPQLNWIEKE